MRKWNIILIIGLVVTLLFAGSQTQAAPGSRYFPETGHGIRGAFQAYWEQHGGLERFGYPLTDEMSERSALNGQTYTVQYFERAEFELHPENAAPYDVLLTQLGTLRYQQKYPSPPADEQISNDSPTLFPQTGKHVGRLLLNAWNRLGGLANVGYPISEELAEQSPLDGKVYMVQYFERAEFEYHPENTAPYDVLLVQLGRFAYDANYGPKPTPTATANIGTEHLNIPQTPDRNQGNPQGSDDYLVWQEGPVTHQYTSTARLKAMNLSSGNVQQVADYCGSYRPAVGGTLVAWAYDPADTCYTFHVRLAAQDLVSGKRYDLAPEAEFYSQVSISERTAVWSGQNFGPNHGAGSWLTSYDFDKEVATTLVSYPYAEHGGILVGRPFVNADYIVWSEYTPPTGPHGVEPGAAWLKLYDRHTEEISTLRYVARGNYALVGLHSSMLVWTGDDVQTEHGSTNLYLTNLDTGTNVLLYSNVMQWQYITLGNDAVVWSAAAPGRSDLDLFGMKLDATNSSPVPLVVVGGDQRNPTFAGKWLVWEDALPNGTGRLNSAALDYLFATASQREHELQQTPTPLPTAVPTNTPLLIGSHINSKPPAVAGRSFFWLSSECGFCGYDVDKGERYLVSISDYSEVNVIGNSKEVAWLQTSPTSRGDIHAFDPTTREESVIMYADGYNVIEFAVTDKFIYYRGTNDGKPGVYQRNRATGVDTLFAPSVDTRMLVASPNLLLWSVVSAGKATLYQRKDGEDSQAIATVSTGVGYYNVSGDNVVWVEPYNSNGSGTNIHLYNISSKTDKVIASGNNIDNPVMAGNKVAWLRGMGTPHNRQVIVYDIDTATSKVVVEAHGEIITDITLAGPDALAYNIDTSALYLVRLPLGAYDPTAQPLDHHRQLQHAAATRGLPRIGVCRFAGWGSDGRDNSGGQCQRRWQRGDGAGGLPAGAAYREWREPRLWRGGEPRLACGGGAVSAAAEQ